jgi:Tol biopolymer transport system component
MNDRQPAWSPDGSKVAFSSDRGQQSGRRAIFVTGWPLGSTGILQLSKGSAQDVHPKWLPDGSGLIFNRIAADGKQADVHVVTLNGVERMIDLGAGLNTYASVDPTARTLVYRGTTSRAGPSGPIENSDVFIAAFDGTNKRPLTDDPAFDGWPAISPDGSTVAFASRRGGDKFRLYLMPLAGGELREVAAPGGFHYTQPAWAPDGKSLVVYRWNADSAGEAGQLVRVVLP